MNIAMVHYGDSPHPAHEGFAESIGADIISCPMDGSSTGFRSTSKEIIHGAQLEYDVLVSEGSRPLISIVSKGIQRDCTIIYLCADQFFYDLNFSNGSNWITKYTINTVFKNIVDGVIAVSDFAAEFVRVVTGAATPIRVVHPYIQSGRFEELRTVSPDLCSPTAVTIASAADGMVGQYKGVDLLVESWSKVRETSPNAILRIIGEGHPEAYRKQKGVQVEGYVDSIASVFADASLYVQPSRADTYPVTVLEALRAGVPSVVTRTTGNRSEIRTIDPMLVSDPTPESLSKKIDYYFQSDTEYKKKLSRIARQRGSQYSPSVWKGAFESEFRSLIEEIES